MRLVQNCCSNCSSKRRQAPAGEGAGAGSCRRIVGGDDRRVRGAFCAAHRSPAPLRGSWRTVSCAPLGASRVASARVITGSLVYPPHSQPRALRHITISHTSQETPQSPPVTKALRLHRPGCSPHPSSWFIPTGTYRVKQVPCVLTRGIPCLRLGFKARGLEVPSVLIPLQGSRARFASATRRPPRGRCSALRSPPPRWSGRHPE